VVVDPQKDRINQSARAYQRKVASASFNTKISVHGRTAPCQPLLPIQGLRRPSLRPRQQPPHQLVDASFGVQLTHTPKSASGVPAKLATSAEVVVPCRLLLRPRPRQQLPLHQSSRNPQPRSPILDAQLLLRRWGVQGSVICKIWSKARKKTANF